MATNDITIGQLEEMTSEIINDDSLLSSVDSVTNYKLKIKTLKDYIVNSISATRPLGEMSLTAITPTQTFTGANFTKITAFDKIQYEVGMDVDVAEDQIVLTTSRDYRVTLSINSEFSTNQGVEFAVLIDGVVAEALGTIQGRGSGKPVYIGGADIDPLVEGNVITVGAREDSGGSVDIIFHKVRLTVEGI